MLKGFLLLLLIITAIGWFSENPDSDGGVSNDERGGIGVVSRSENCKTNWRACETNEAFVEQNEDGFNWARIQCKYYANSVAKYGVEWDWLSGYYSYINNGSLRKDGTLLLIDTDGRWGNAFGAFGKVRSECGYDLISGSVLYVLPDH